MGKKTRNFTYQHPKKRKKKKVSSKPQPNVTINRIKRILEPKVPEDINLEQLAELYLLQGVRRGVGMVVMLPQQLIDAVARGEMPTKVETVVLLKKIKEGIESAHRAAVDQLEKRQADLESVIGYRPVDEDALVQPDQFIRIIAIPTEEGGGFCAEMDPQHRGIGATKREALEHLATLLEEAAETE